MKKQFLPLITALVLGGASAANAQITVTSNDLTFGVDTDTMYVLEVDTAGLVLPSVGTDQLWDYSGIIPTDSSKFSYEASNQSAPFSTTTAMIPNYLLKFGEFDVTDVTTYFTQTDTGFVMDGYHIKAQEYSLANPNDTLKVLEQDVEIGLFNVLVPFDLTDNTTRTETVTEKIQFTLDYSAMGFSNVPGYLLRTTIKNHEVVGWGSVILPVTNDTVEALLLHSTNKIIDSVYLNGSPIDATLLTGTGLSQGAVSFDNMISLVAKEFNNFAATFEVDSSNTVINYANFIDAAYYIDNTPPVDTSSINKVAKNTINAYPNPVKDVLTIQLTNTQKAYAEVYNIEGRLVSRQALKDAQINVSTLKVGSYIAIIKSENEVLGNVRFIKE